MAYVLTSLSGNLISAASAGYAPTNSADVSAIASAYSESAASSKLDSTASSSFYPSDNPSGFISGVDLSDYATTAYVDSSISGFAYESAVSGWTAKQDMLTFGYDDSAISSINGSALAGGGGATGDYVEKSAMEVAIGSGNTVSSTAFAQGADNVASGASVAFGMNNVATDSSIAVGNACSSDSNALAVGASSTAWTNALAVGYRVKATNQGLAVGDRCSASTRGLAFGYYASAYRDSVAAGNFCSAKNTAVAFGTYNLHVDGDTSTGDSAAFVIGDGTASTARHDLMLVTKDGEITMYSSTADTSGTGIMSSIRALSANAGGVDSATVSAIASSYAESAVSSKLDESATADFYSTSNPSGFITGVDLSNYATTAYVDSSVSGKLDTTAFNSGDFYTTANPSGFIDSAYVDSAVSGKADSSALSSYVPYSSLEYNTASAISGINGSALAAGSTYSAGEGIDITDDVISVEAPVDIVAGPGIVIDNPDGNTLRVSVDENYETVLWSGTPTNSKTLTEPMWNFERIRIEFYDGVGQYSDPYGSPVYAEISVKTTSTHFNVQHTMLSDGNFGSDWEMHSIDSNGTGVTLSHMKRVLNGWSQGSFVFQTPTNSLITKIVGIHRINGGN